MCMCGTRRWTIKLLTYVYVCVVCVLCINLGICVYKVMTMVTPHSIDLHGVNETINLELSDEHGYST